MRTIWKFDLLGESEQVVRMPQGAQLIHVGHQEGTFLRLWAIVDDDMARPTEDRRIAIVGTGHQMPESATPDNHIATVIEGSFVWHVFDITEERF